MNDVLKSIGTDLSYGQKICDGSGLSRQDYISPDFICRFLTSMMSSPYFEEYLNSLPVPGGNGSLNFNMKNVPLNIRSRIRVKSGSMNGVRCYSGYILPEGYTFTPGQDIPESIKNQIIIFSIMTNNCTSPNWKVRPMLDRLMEDIAGYRPTCQ